MNGPDALLTESLWITQSPVVRVGRAPRDHLVQHAHFIDEACEPGEERHFPREQLQVSFLSHTLSFASWVTQACYFTSLSLLP